MREPGQSKRSRHTRYVTNFFMASAPRHPFWKHALGLLRPRARHKDVMSAAGPYFLNAAWESYSKKRTRRCGASTRSADAPLPYHELQEAYAVHFWAGTWHVRNLATAMPRGLDTIIFDRTQQLWLGANHSENCAAAAPDLRFVEETWACYDSLWPCPRPTWARFDRECGGIKSQCPSQAAAENEWWRRSGGVR